MSNHPNRSRQTPSPARNPTPEEIRRVRESADLTQVEAARLIYTSARAWQQWEAGERRMHPAWWTLFRLRVGVLTLAQLTAA